MAQANSLENGARMDRSLRRAIDGLPIVDKDLLPDVISDYAHFLRQKGGVTGKTLDQSVENMAEIVFDGNPQVTHAAVEHITTLVGGGEPKRLKKIF